jgi:hypothetical protein
MLWKRDVCWLKPIQPLYTAPVRGRGETGRRKGLKQLECPRGNPRCRTAQIRGNRSQAIPSQARQPNGCCEGVETRRAAPDARTRYGEGIVQTTNSAGHVRCRAMAAKAVAGKKIPRLERAVPVQVRPPAPRLFRFPLLMDAPCIPLRRAAADTAEIAIRASAPSVKYRFHWFPPGTFDPDQLFPLHMTV